LAPDTPTIVVAAATRPEQLVITGTLVDIAERMGQAAPDGPVLVMIGRALGDAARDAAAGDDEEPDGESQNGRKHAS
jgi:uroporphyrin-III C-methyltransferase/precorrin-2 dehydrogenase/sirohydrochlorin ferrochelatase